MADQTNPLFYRHLFLPKSACRTARILAILTIPWAMTTPAYTRQACPVETDKLTASDGESPNQFFGRSTSIGRSTAVVGTTLHDHNNNGSTIGAAYIFEKVNGVWTEQAELLPIDGSPDFGHPTLFGRSVSISRETPIFITDETVVIGSAYDSTIAVHSGAVYIFQKVGGVAWLQIDKLTASDGSAEDHFGYSVSISKDTIVIGAPRDDNQGNSSGSAYIFEKVNGVWTEQAKLLPADGAQGDLFGEAVSISDNMAIIGSQRDDANGTRSGSAYIFEKVNGVWTEQAKLLPADGGVSFGQFGEEVSISGNTAVIGSPYVDPSAYIFEKINGVWTEQAKLLPDDGSPLGFGTSVSIDGDTIVIGASRSDDLGPSSGSAHVYTKRGNTWIKRAKLLASDGEGGDWFGNSVSVANNSAIIGAYLDDHTDIGFGSAYIFDMDCLSCLVDINGDGTLNLFDISAFLDAFNNQDPIADFNDDGSFNFFDISAFLSAFRAGCP